MTNHTNESSGRDRWLRAVLWLPGLLVALGAAAATAHGLYEVAAATGTPPLIAGLYPVITDGLALVAYAATPRLDGRGRRYAWTVVVLAAGLSGIAQAAYLAGAGGHAPTLLRVVIGAWPAIAAAIVAHLLFLIGHANGQHTAEPVQPEPSAGTEYAPEPTTSTGVRPGTVQPAVQPEPVKPAVQPCVQSAVQPTGEGPAVGEFAAERTAPFTSIVQPGRAGPEPLNTGPETAEIVGSGEVSAKDRALAAAETFRGEHGNLPTTSQLADRARVSRGTAGNALKTLRADAKPLHLVADHERDQASGSAQQEAHQ